ncbi:serine hydrolase domain-containing protein [Corallococcus sicarius]|uniref:Class A beta-lactamase-related serine hydrolase n=1 Tax=Corallococcus sicarius TaxID=2316726 RepID=A0A3A8P573_9BACT|nr:serine hydrolase domain-containing protein [Corallococcus sicarius]RKH47612.1 class A beta-lactamase-related serine hydrolase [Corallococcus sicarius]
MDVTPTQLLSRSRKHATVLLATALFAGHVFAAEPKATGPSPRNGQPPNVLAALEHGLRPSTLKSGEPLPGWSLQERMAFHHVPGVAIAVLRDGKVVQAVGFGVREAGTQDAVNADTLFSVGSVSKVVTAATTLRKVAAGKLDLDRDVNTYLTSWRIPKAPTFANDKVSLRMLMSHTSGLTVWGFEDYLPDEKLPTLVQTLDGVAPAKNEPVRIDFEPGTRMRYSGGGVTVEQLVLENTTRQPLETIARGEVFQRVGMRRSTFVNPLPASLGNIAKAHDKDGQRAALPRGWETFPEQAASGLWTSANELGAFVGTLINSYRGKSDFLPQPIALQMMTEVSPSLHGLGPRLEGEGQTRIFHHGGSNDSYRAWIEGYLETGDGMVILTNSPGGSRLMVEIRNALSDALGRGINPVARTVELAPAVLANYTGTYRLDARVPNDLTGNLAGHFESDTLEVGITEGTLTVTETQQPPRKLQPLSPTRFLGPVEITQLRFEFLRNARGVVYALVAERGNAKVYFRRDAAKVVTP